jgi:hypothetical protein
MGAMWKKDHSLPDNYSQFLAVMAQSIPQPALQKIDDTFGLMQTGMLDTHPCNSARIQLARRLDQQGIIRCPEPASRLFQDFRTAAAAVTLLHYRNLRVPITKESLKSVGQTPSEREEEQRQLGARLDKYFCGLLPLLQPVTLPPEKLSPPVNFSECCENAKNFRLRIAPVVGQIAEMVTRYLDAESNRTRANVAMALADAGCNFDADAYGVPEASFDAAHLAAAQAEEASKQAQHSLSAVSGELAAHFSSTLSLVFLPSVTEKITLAGQWQREIRLLAGFLNQFPSAYSILLECQRENSVLGAFLPAKPGTAKAAGAAGAAHRLSDGLYRLRESTVALKNPLLEGKQTVCLFDQLCGPQPDSSDRAGLHSFATVAITRHFELLAQVLARLVEISESVVAVL